MILKRIGKLFEPGETLSQRVIRSGFWVFALRIINKIINLAQVIILARILTPEDFGLFGIAFLALSILETFSQTGFELALIQKKGKIEEYLNVAWTVSVIRGIILFLLLYFIAPVIAQFFNAPVVVPIIRIIGFTLLIRGFINIGIIYIQKELEFHKQFIYEFSATLFDFIVAITCAILLHSVWALLFGFLAGNLVRLAGSYIIVSYRPRISLDIRKISDLYQFGRWVFYSGILGFLLTQGDDLFVAKFLKVSFLGFYQLAYKFSNVPATEITHIVSQVSFPAYSKLQDDPQHLGRAYLKILKLTAFLSIPLSGGIIILAPEFVSIFLGNKWIPMVPPMQILTIWGLIRSIGGTVGPVLCGYGKPEIVVKIQFFHLILLSGLIYPFTLYYGIIGTSLSVVIAGFIANVAAWYKVINITKCGLKNFSKAIGIPVINTVLMLFMVYILKSLLLYPINLLEFFSIAIFMVIGFSVLTLVMEKFFNYGIKVLIKESITLLYGR